MGASGCQYWGGLAAILLYWVDYLCSATCWVLLKHTLYGVTTTHLPQTIPRSGTGNLTTAVWAVIEKHGVGWDEFAEMAFKLTRPKKQQYGWDMKVIWGDGWYLFTFLPFVWGNGGDLLTPEGDRAVIWSKCGKEAGEAVTFWAEQVARGVNADDHPSGEGFWELAAAMRIDGSSVVNYLLDIEETQGERWSVVPVPRRDGGKHSSFVGGDAAGIPTDAHNVPEAVEFIRFAMSEQAQEALAAAGNLPASMAYFQNPHFMQEPRFQKMALAMEHARTLKTLYLQ